MPKILAIDDKRDNLISISALLKALIPDCQVITAQSGAEGLGKAEAELPDAILLDIKMPGMDGYEVCKKLKESASTKHIPVIMISAIRTEAVDLAKGLDAGADAYLPKPVDECVLAAQVKTALRMKATDDQLRQQKDLLESKVQERTKELQESEKKFRVMMESMSDPVSICSADCRVEYMNPAMIKRTGRDATGEFCYKALHDFNQQCPWCKGKSELRGKIFESNIVSPKDNHSYNVSHSPIVNDDGSVSSITIFRDTTEFKKMEAQFYQAQKMEAIGTLAGGVAHDFNNILTVLRGHAQLGMMQTTAENPLWNDLVEIEAAGDRASKLTRQLLAFSRKQDIKSEMIQINYLLNDLNEMLKRLIGEDVHLKTDLNEKLSPILADPGQIEQIIINLVVNAADAIKGQPLVSGRNISISTSEVLLDSDFVISHEGSKPGWHLILEVADNGCGIPKEVMEHIFEPFYTTKEVGKGTGLGLSTVYGIVKQNNASIYVESEPGQGTTFKIYWPNVKDEASKIIKNKKLAPAPGGSEVILLVEDEKPTRKLALRILQQAGYTVIEAENGLDALEKTKDLQGSIDLVFTDVVMPVMGGKELNEKLSNIYPQIKFLFTSGYLSDRVDRNDAIFKDGTFIDKPYDVPVVLSKIRQLLDSRTAFI